MDYAKVVDGKAVRIKTFDESDSVGVTKLLAHGYVALDESHTVDLQLFPCYAFGERPHENSRRPGPEQGWDKPTYTPWDN
jgi:hypothetical protein